MAQPIKVMRWLLFAFVVYLIYQVGRKILGGSWGIEELATAFLVANLGYSFHLNSRLSVIDSKISGHIGWHRGRDSHG